MEQKTKKWKKIISTFDWISLGFGITGVLFGLLSLFALVDFWSENPDVRNKDSLIFTIVTLIVDSVSVSAAMISFAYGFRIYRTLNLHEKDLIKVKLVLHEKKSFIYDALSFGIGIIGMCFGLTSLLTITPFPNDQVSKIVTGIGIICDTTSSLMIVFAINEYAKYLDTREIAVYLREHTQWDQLKQRLNIKKLRITPKKTSRVAHKKNEVVDLNPAQTPPTSSNSNSKKDN